ncbi:MAG: sulfite exporter TauE/SafE family protein [Burkholderiaceae bacterium]|nr:sulfite exporter TauE/SafE family protein [Burkholderiaceae bacterium]
MLTASLLGSLTGLILGLTGAGGGILAVPALAIGLGFSMTLATPVALIAVGMAAFTGALDGLYKHQVRYKAALFMAITGSLTAGLGLRLAQLIPETVLASVFSLLMLWVALRMYRQGQASGANNGQTATAANKPCIINPATGRLRWTRRCTATLAGIGALTGLCAGMLGVGGGFIIVPAFKRYTNLSMHSIVATSLMVIALIAAFTAAHSIWQGTDIPALGWYFAVAAIAGMVLGRILAPYLPASTLQKAFALVTVLVAGVLMTRTWMPALA